MGYKVFANGQLFTTSDLDALLMSQVIIRCTSTTRPPQPAEGWHIYETDTQKLRIYQTGRWVDDTGAGQDLVAVKAADQVFSSTSDTGITDLSVPVQANTQYVLECFLAATCTGSGSFLDFDFVIPSNANVYLVTNHPASDEGPVNKAARQTGAIAMASYVQPSGSVVQIRGFLQVGAVAGNFSVNVRTTTSGQPITIKALSTIRLRKVI
ncbi:hypothetical protein AB0O28_18725 [Microbispora sp. NPDC088329]|uniref:hypothetical protein n=1 Tax=Microbispora sp. NPDC088329 TaxID=3154869 RepID=UPI00342F5867